MSMLKLVADTDLCSECSKCEDILQGMTQIIKKDGGVVFKPTNPLVDWERISRVIRICKPGALGIERTV